MSGQRPQTPAPTLLTLQGPWDPVPGAVSSTVANMHDAVHLRGASQALGELLGVTF